MREKNGFYGAIKLVVLCLWGLIWFIFLRCYYLVIDLISEM